MKGLKYFLYTLLYIVLMELSAVWTLVLEYFNVEYYEFYGLIQGFIQLLIIIGFIYLWHRESIKALIKRPKAKWIIIALFFGFLFTFIQSPLNLIYNFIMGTEYKILYDFNGFDKFKSLNIISIILLIPLGEELFFRGFIQRKLQLDFKPATAILLASFMFALIHAPYLNILYIFLESGNSFMEDWHLFYLTFFGGVISGILFFKSKSLIPSIIFHILWNIIASVI